jgi:hypothetical protein
VFYQTVCYAASITPDMLQYKIRTSHLGWSGQEALQDDGRFAALVQDLNRKLTACTTPCYSCKYCVPEAFVARKDQAQASMQVWKQQMQPLPAPHRGMGCGYVLSQM